MIGTRSQSQVNWFITVLNTRMSKTLKIATLRAHHSNQRTELQNRLRDKKTKSNKRINPKCSLQTLQIGHAIKANSIQISLAIIPQYIGCRSWLRTVPALNFGYFAFLPTPAVLIFPLPIETALNSSALDKQVGIKLHFQGYLIFQNEFQSNIQTSSVAQVLSYKSALYLPFEFVLENKISSNNTS